MLKRLRGALGRFKRGFQLLGEVVGGSGDVPVAQPAIQRVLGGGDVAALLLDGQLLSPSPSLDEGNRLAEEARDAGPALQLRAFSFMLHFRFLARAFSGSGHLLGQSGYAALPSASRIFSAEWPCFPT